MTIPVISLSQKLLKRGAPPTLLGQNTTAQSWLPDLCSQDGHSRWSVCLFCFQGPSLGTHTLHGDIPQAPAPQAPADKSWNEGGGADGPLACRGRLELRRVVPCGLSSQAGLAALFGGPAPERHLTLPETYDHPPLQPHPKLGRTPAPSTPPASGTHAGTSCPCWKPPSPPAPRRALWTQHPGNGVSAELPESQPQESPQEGPTHSGTAEASPGGNHHSTSQKPSSGVPRILSP